MRYGRGLIRTARGAVPGAWHVLTAEPKGGRPVVWTACGERYAPAGLRLISKLTLNSKGSSSGTAPEIPTDPPTLPVA